MSDISEIAKEAGEVLKTGISNQSNSNTFLAFYVVTASILLAAMCILLFHQDMINIANGIKGMREDIQNLTSIMKH